MNDLKCDICNSSEKIESRELIKEEKIDLCELCFSQIQNPETLNPENFRNLSVSMWSEKAVVQALSSKILNFLIHENWAQNLKEQIYLSPEAQIIEKKISYLSENDDEIICKDSNGTRLLSGDSVTLIKDLVVKGANFTAKRGTLVKNISLTENPLHIEGKVNGTQIVLVAAFLKKA